MLYSVFFKNLIDRLVGLIGTIISFPIVLFIIILIKLESRGPGIFKQIRVGKNTRNFNIYKLRTMTYNPSNTGSYFTHQNDTRITRIGKILRITSLDELPQFWNLLLGDMSLIGPRPDLPIQKTNYTNDEWSHRHKIKPGITGLAQAIKRSNCTEKQRKRLDFFYVNNINVFLDCYIVLKTFKILIRRGVQN